MYDVSESMVALLTKQGMRAGSAGTETVHGKKMRGAASDGAHSRVTDRCEGGQSNPIGRAGGDWRQMGNSGKGPAVNAPAKFTGLHVVVDNSRCKPMRTERSIGFHLVLVK
jgi:hypothetical protein